MNVTFRTFALLLVLWLSRTGNVFSQEDTTISTFDVHEETSDQDNGAHNAPVAKRSKMPVSVYVVVGAVPFATSDFQDFDVSDWQKYGLRSEDPGSLEGRVRLPLREDNPNGYNPCVNLGINIPVGSRFSLPLDIMYASGNNFLAYAISLGISYNLIERKKFQLAILASAGYISSTVDFGTVQLIDGYTAPVIIDQGTFTNGDNIQATMSGAVAQAGIRPVIALSKKISLVLDAGYAFGFISSTTIEVNDGSIKLNMDDPAIVRPDGSGVQAGLKPSVNMLGVYFKAGIQFRLSKISAQYIPTVQTDIWNQ